MRKIRRVLAASILAVMLVPLNASPAQAHAHEYLCPAEFPYGVLRAVIGNVCRVFEE
jgi:hypothetical protein